MAEELIPGLPDDMARECLIRVPYADFCTVSWVCKLWKREIESSSFHLHRRSNGHARSIVVLVQSEPLVEDLTAGKNPVWSSARTSNYHLTLMDPAADTWQSLPPIPWLPNGLPLFCRVAVAGRKLVVVGGLDPITWTATDAVYIYDLVSATWHRGARMPGPARSFFACSASEYDGGEVVAVAGGHDGGKNALRSALAYHVEGDRWVPLPDMAEERDECGGVFLGGKFYAVGGYATENQGVFSTSAEAFDFRSWEWGPVVEEEDLGGHVASSESTRKAAAFPEEMRSASQMITLEGGGLRMLAVGHGGHGGAQMIYLLNEEEQGKGNELNFKWKNMNIPYEYSGHIQAASSVLI